MTTVRLFMSKFFFVVQDHKLPAEIGNVILI